MRFNILITLACAGLFTSFINKPDQYDVCIYGGTSAGVIAAYTAAKMGKSVLLIEPGRHLGGLSSGGLGYTDIGNKYAITGLARDFYRRTGRHYGKFEQWIFEPHVAEKVFNEYIKNAGIPVLYEYRIVKAEKNNGFIKQVVLENSSAPSTRTNKTIAAKMFIDCSYEGDLMTRSGVYYTIGRESNSTYKETYNGVQLMGGHQFPDGIDPYKIPGDTSSGLLWGISEAKLSPDGTGDKKVQAYNYRICLTNDPKNRSPFTCPGDYDSTRYELLLRLFKAQPDKRALNDYFIFSKMPNHKTDINNRGGFSSDMIGMNHDYPEASYTERAAIIKKHEAYTKGLLYFYSKDPRVPVELRNEMLQWGFPKDEYVDNGNWSPQLYIRECRRMIGAYVMTQANCEGREIVNDGAGMAAYTMDSHNCQRIVVNGMVKNEGNVEIGGFGPYPISYRSLIPNETECKNLYVPVCLSASHIAYGSIRMEPVFMVLAQSSAVAACMAIDKKQTVQQVDVKSLQAYLEQNPLMDGSTPEVLVDNDDTKKVLISGDWKKEIRGGYGPSLLMTEPSDTEKKVQFKPFIIAAGKYAAYVYFPKTANASTQTHMIVFDGKTSKNIIIHKSEVQVEGQTSGEWVSLGTYALEKGIKSYVIVTNKSADGTVVADAVLFVPLK
ncbi:MAG: FAD-dependent oxidoreductase [Sphingobacteriales bacterium]